MSSQVAPHQCVECGSPAYLPFSGGTKCTNMRCQHHDQDLWCEWLLEDLPDEPQVELDIEVGDDEPTEPQLAFFTSGRFNYPTGSGGQLQDAIDALDEMLGRVPQPFILVPSKGGDDEQ